MNAKWTVFNIYLLTAIVSAEFYRSLTLLKTIIGTEKSIPIIINDYVEKELKRLDHLNKFAQEIQEHNDKAIRDGEEAIRHPINAFLLIKAMISNWNKVVKIMRSNSADGVILNVTRQMAIRPCNNYLTKEDLSEAATRLLQLHDANQMNNKDIAKGKILNSELQTVDLTAGDCFEIGRAAYRAYDYYHTIMWMQEARERVEKEAVPTANLEDILEHLAFSMYKQGNLKRALLLTDELYRMNPDHPRAKDNVKEYEDLLEDNGVQHTDMRRDIPPVNNVRDDDDLDASVKLMYEALCRQALSVNASLPCV
uniref:P4Ha_N domain-containing protein n=1 Tax=Onchocerca volvulus TaxID=6282 RepID=A0A2K6VMQ6_ONCVO